ncbi:hypothetical protein EZV62_002063 [Acer yangbiense]|uniref:Glycoside hydrolase family 3 N-terminal domain-containing protein n=1 Tax=Acer yangbiense TaxID=1000413 RepID=A0A5C7IX51_9ROSI|nr:hypothetical protein EZV62_002063 [Acer yangbiense]
MRTCSTFPIVGTVVLLCLLAASSTVEAEYMKYKDPKQPKNTRIKDLMSRMTLSEKIGQMVQLDRTAATAEIMKDYSIGSILSGGGSVPRPQATPVEWIKMVNDFQNGSLSSRLGIPMIYGIDAVHGHNNVYKATVFPHNVGLGATRDPDLVKRIGAATALEVRATGIDYVFAPCIAVCRDPRWGRCFESYSEDPRVVIQMTEIIPGLQGDIPSGSPKGVPYVGGRNKVAACAKHFVGDGGTTNGINENNTVIDRHGLLSIHMPGYYHSIIKGVSTIMDPDTDCFHICVLQGFVISDWQGIDRITSPPHANYSYSVLAGVNAGIDMFMLPFNHTDFIDILTGYVNNNIVPMSRIDDAVRRILRVKFTMGLFENPLADQNFVDQLGSQAHRDLAREAVRKSLVLLKNRGDAQGGLLTNFLLVLVFLFKFFIFASCKIKILLIDLPNLIKFKILDFVSAGAILPLSKNASRILVAGTHANNLGYQCGGWTITWQGLDGNNHSTGTTILSGITSAVDKNTQVLFSENPDSEFLESNKPFDYAIVVVGETPYAETFGDSMNLTLSEPGPNIISKVCGAVKCVVVIVSGRPVVIEPYLDEIYGLVAAWLPGTEGQGVADVLFGDYGFNGTLPRTWFRNVDQLPMNFGDSNYDPLFSFGYGLIT